MFTKMDTDLETAQAQSVYDTRNWIYGGIHDETFLDRIHDLEISIRSQKQSFSEMDHHLLLCLFNFCGAKKAGHVVEIGDLEEFFSFFKHYVDELIQAQSMKSQQFFNEMKKMQGRDFFYEIMSDLVENRLVYCGFITYRTDLNRRLRVLSVFDNTSSLLVFLTIELQRYYKGLADHPQRTFPRLEEDIEIDPEQLELLPEISEEVLVDEDLNKSRLDELFQFDQKIYKFIFADGSFFYIHPQGLLDLPHIVQKKMFEVYKYYYLRRTVDNFIRKLMETIITEINKLKKSGPEFTVDTVFRIFQEGTWDKNTLLPWYYWATVVSEKLSNQKKLKESLKKYYQAASFLQSFLHIRAKSIEESGEDVRIDEEEVEVVTAGEPVSATEKLSDINALLRLMHEKPDFYNFDSICRLGYNLGIKEKYDSPQNEGYTAFIEFFLDKVTGMVSQKTGLPYVREIEVGKAGQEMKYYVYTTDIAVAFLAKRDTVANGFGFHYAELFSQPNPPVSSQGELDVSVEELTQNREPLFYKLYVSHLEEIYKILVRSKNLDEVKLLFVNNKSDAPRPLAEILRLDFDQLERVGEKLEAKHQLEVTVSEGQVTEGEVTQMQQGLNVNRSRMDEMQEAMRQTKERPAGKGFSLLDWLLSLLGFGKKKKRTHPASGAGEAGLAAGPSWRERLGKAFNSAIDHDLAMKRNQAQAMKNLFAGGGMGANRVKSKDLQDKAFKKMRKDTAGSKDGNNAMTPRQLLRVVEANILESCGLTGLPIDEALERLEDEWNEVMRIASEQELSEEKQGRKKTVHKKINEVMGYQEFSLTRSSAEQEIKDKAHEIAGYPEIGGLVKRDDKKIYLEWYITLLMIVVLNKKLA